MNDPAELQLRKIFFPYATSRLEAVKEENMRFVHYTSAEVAASIISKKEIWMRNASTMNDFMEVQHGMRCLKDAYNGTHGKRLRNLLAPHFPKLFPELERRFNGWSPHFLTDTYILCVSEHRPAEDDIGRLSMWRAYGAGSGVAIVFKNTPFLSDSDALSAYSSPVAYLHGEDFNRDFGKVVDGIAREIDFVRAQGEESILSWLFSMLRYAVVSTKHHGFGEELEWRVVHSPQIEPSTRLICSIETVRGTPQRVYKIPLRNVPEENFVGVEVPELIDHLIIGPTQFPYAIADALHRLLEQAGVSDAGNKIKVSNIPLRT